jgi:hypothetical protein
MLQVSPRSQMAPRMTTRVFHSGYVYDPVMMDHRELDVEEDEGPHPEQPLRIQRIYMAIKGYPLLSVTLSL